MDLATFTEKNLNGKLRYFSAVLSMDTVSYLLEKFLRLLRLAIQTSQVIQNWPQNFAKQALICLKFKNG